MATRLRHLTPEQFARLPDNGRRLELIDGEVVELAPPGGEHGQVTWRLALQLARVIREDGPGVMLTNDPGIVLRRDPDRVRAPDLCYYAEGRLPENRAPQGFPEIIPDWVIEVVSPFDSAAEVQEKMLDWLNAGVRLVWAVYPATRSVVAYHGLGDIRTYLAGETIDGAPVLSAFSCSVGKFFP